MDLSIERKLKVNSCLSLKLLKWNHFCHWCPSSIELMMHECHWCILVIYLMILHTCLSPSFIIFTFTHTFCLSLSLSRSPFLYFLSILNLGFVFQQLVFSFKCKTPNTVVSRMKSLAILEYERKNWEMNYKIKWHDMSENSNWSCNAQFGSVFIGEKEHKIDQTNKWEAIEWSNFSV